MVAISNVSNGGSRPRLDPEEVINHLTPDAIALWEECDPYISNGIPVNIQYMEQGIDLTLRTLVSIALLPTTDPEDAR